MKIETLESFLLGNSYVLEFVSTEWIQCAYNPPYLDEFGEEYEDEEESA